MKLILAGEFATEEYKRKILSMPEMEYVGYKGVLGWDSICKIYQKVSIGMSTLLNSGQYDKMDNLPTKVYEYVSMGLPVIISDSPYNRIAGKEKFGICVDPFQPEDIAQAILQLLNYLEEAKSMVLLIC